jgi:hypothetical protein
VSAKTDLPLIFVHDSAHVHVADVRMVIVVIRKRGVMGGEATEREHVCRELVQNGCSYGHSVLSYHAQPCSRKVNDQTDKG